MRSLLLSAVFLFFACSKAKSELSTVEMQAKENMRMIGKIDMGESKERVIKMLGTPDLSQSVFIGFDEIEFLFYRTQATGKGKEVDLTPFAFKQERIVGLGWPFFRMLEYAAKRDNSVISNLRIEHTIK